MLNTLDPPRVPPDTLRAFVQRAYGVTGRWSMLEGERDQNFRVETEQGRSITLKVCNPNEGDTVLDCQASALEHIALADPALPVPRLIRTLGGDRLGRLNTDGESSYPVMALSWLEGRVLGTDALSPAALFELGTLLARLGLAMRGFVNGAPAMRDLVWDMGNVLRLTPEVASLAPEDRPLATEILAHHRDVTEPALRRMCNDPAVSAQVTLLI